MNTYDIKNELKKYNEDINKSAHKHMEGWGNNYEVVQGGTLIRVFNPKNVRETFCFWFKNEEGEWRQADRNGRYR